MGNRRAKVYFLRSPSPWTTMGPHEIMNTIAAMLLERTSVSENPSRSARLGKDR